MQYKINNVPIEDYGFRPGWLQGKKDSSFALAGMFDLPARTGKTYYEWPNGIEPYIDADEIVFGGRDLTLNLICKAENLTVFKTHLDVLYGELQKPVVLWSELFGPFMVTVTKSTVGYHKNGWASVTLYLHEDNPAISKILLPAQLGDVYGIDGYSWQELGFVIETISGRYDLGQTKETGVRAFTTLVLKATLKAGVFADLQLKVNRLQSLFAAPGLRAVKYFDGTQVNCFAASGFTITTIKNYGNGYRGTFEIKLIVA